MWPKVGGLGWDPNMSSPFKRNVDLKDEDEEIIIESLLVPMGHLLVVYLSIGLMLL